MFIKTDIPDPVISSIMGLVEKEAAAESPRKYLGASSIGDKCERKLWYRLNRPAERAPIPAMLILAANDGHRAEELMAALLRKVPGVELWTVKPDGSQYGFADLEDKFKGHIDGVIKGLPQAPKTPHIWEHKCCNQKKYDNLLKLRTEHGEKETLKKWNYVYYCQAQIYMHYFEMERHYMTISLAGLRAFSSLRTEFDKNVAQALIDKAKRIINAKTPPFGISLNPSFFECAWCEFNEHCHNLRE